MLVVMGNTMKEAKNHLAIYDLKGSTVKRLVKDNEIESARTTLKDVNLLRDPVLQRQPFYMQQ